eukprot:3070789-Ditylum_brightwellii.AAC.1
MLCGSGCYATHWGDVLQGISGGPRLKNEESTLFGSTSVKNDASVAPSEDSQSTNAIGYTYGLRSLDTVMPEVSDSIPNIRALYSEVETPCICNKKLNSDPNDAINTVAGYMDDEDTFNSSHQQSVSSYESSVIDESTSCSIVSNEPSAEGEEQNSFPSDQPIICCFANNDKTSYKKGYDSDWNLSYWDPVSLNDDT